MEKGLTKAIGLANASMSQLTAVLGFSKVSPAVNSVEVWALPQHRLSLSNCCEEDRLP